MLPSGIFRSPSPSRKDAEKTTSSLSMTVPKGCGHNASPAECSSTSLTVPRGKRGLSPFGVRDIMPLRSSTDAVVAWQPRVQLDDRNDSLRQCEPEACATAKYSTEHQYIAGCLSDPDILANGNNHSRKPVNRTLAPCFDSVDRPRGLTARERDGRPRLPIDRASPDSGTVFRLC